MPTLMPTPVPTRINRPDDAPKGQVRAQMATFPARAGIVRRVIHAILPQVDHLYIVLNGYDAVPADLADEPRIIAVIPDRDLRDAGKFWFAPDPQDIVFLIDDDVTYPADYAARSIDRASLVGWDGNAFGYMANIWNATLGWQHYRMRDPLAHAIGARLVGTGTALARGDMIAPLAAIEAGHGHVDIVYAHWLAGRGGRLWALPRDDGWMWSKLPPELQATSLFVTEHRNMPGWAQRLLMQLVAMPLPHDGTPFTPESHRQAATPRRVAAAKEA